MRIIIPDSAELKMLRKAEAIDFLLNINDRAERLYDIDIDCYAHSLKIECGHWLDKHKEVLHNKSQIKILILYNDPWFGGMVEFTFEDIKIELVEHELVTISFKKMLWGFVHHPKNEFE